MSTSYDTTIGYLLNDPAQLQNYFQVNNSRLNTILNGLMFNISTSILHIEANSTINSSDIININNLILSYSNPALRTENVINTNMITTSNLLVTSIISASNLFSTTSTIPNIIHTNISSSTLNISNGITSASILNTGLISTSNLTALTSTLPNAVCTNISSGTINISTGITSASILNTGLISTANLTSTSATIENARFTNITSNTLLINTLVSTPNLVVTNISVGSISAGNINSSNDIKVSGYLLFGEDSFYIASTGANSTTSTSFTSKLTGTTGTLNGGTYMLSTQYFATAAGASSARSGEVRTLVDGILTSTVGNIPCMSSTQNIPLYQLTNITLSNAIHTIDVQYRATNSSTGAGLQQLKVWLYRIA